MSEANESELTDLLGRLDAETRRLHSKARDEGYKDEKCPKCGEWLLAHHHFIRCEHAPCGNCPMTSGPSLLEKFAP